MDPFRFTVAMGPLAVYLLVLGLINLRSRPFLTTGGRDIAALAVGLCGFVMAGPMELFLPEQAAIRFGNLVWVLLLALYVLSATLLVLMVRPRIVIYNISAETLRPILSGVVAQLDKEARWAGECLVLPGLHVQLNLESFPILRNVQLVSAGHKQNYAGWRRLEYALAAALRETEGSRNLYGLSMVIFSLLIFLMSSAWLISDLPTAMQAATELLRL